MADLHGTCDERFAAVQATFARFLDTKDVGASVAVSVGDELVVDLWGGYADARRTRPWERDTITCVWSTTKTMTALCLLVLADRGVVDLDAPVASYWPEFGAAGKENVLVRHVLGHTAGLPTWHEPLRTEQLYDWEAMTSLLAEQQPSSPPGEVGAYHAITQGYLLGEVVRRVTGRSLAAFFADEVAGPLDADFRMVVAPEEDHRVAEIIPATSRAPELSSMGEGNPPLPAEVANTEAWRRADIPSAAGYGNARSVAAVQAVLGNGGVAHGVRLLSKAGCERVLEQQFAGTDQVFDRPIRYGMGYSLQGRACSWGGWGGSLVLVDLDTGLTVAYVMNRMLEEGPLGDDRGLELLMAAYDGLLNVT
ncbi:serine hydrolase domain-containing protein [Kribbella lupini]|uniref:Serine hydrolase domain-containing protein n=1 Tax=Kribbella lupini TaxID=291602 RepID=A0ABN2BNP5_9ACTN